FTRSGNADSSLHCTYLYISLIALMPVAVSVDGGKDKEAIDTILPWAHSECEKDSAHLPIIKSLEVDFPCLKMKASTRSRTRSKNSNAKIFFLLDLVCNYSTRRLEWADGTPNYILSGIYDIPPIDCVSEHKTAISDTKHDEWLIVLTTNIDYQFTVLCVTDDYDVTTSKPTTATTTSITTVKTTVKPTTAIMPTAMNTVQPTENPTETCGDYSMMTTSEDAKKPCFKVITDRLSWHLAQSKCAADFGSLITINSAEENKYFWRTAISTNMLYGIHIVHISPRATLVFGHGAMVKFRLTETSMTTS
ncbi:hypothetical protein PENTCL1PPCAC_20260, partial [Pristionchus entomophagus]